MQVRKLSTPSPKDVDCIPSTGFRIKLSSVQWSYMYMNIISQFTVKTQTSLHICAVSLEPLQYIVCIQYNMVSITSQDMKGTYRTKKKRVQLNNKKNPVFVQVIVLFAGINDIIHGWTINTVIFPKACYRLWEPHCTVDDAPSNQKINLFSKF